MIKKSFALLALAVLFLTFGCSKKSDYYGDSNDNYSAKKDVGMLSLAASSSESWAGTAYNLNGSAGLEDSVPQRAREPAVSDNPAVSVTDTAAERKLVKRANIKIRVDNLNETGSAITGLLEKFNAYSASTIIEENAYTYSLRVPSQKYEVFLAEMDGMGRTIRRTESTEDVTVQYYDLEGRLTTKKELLRTFQSYLGKAKTIDEILSVERRISELQYDIDGTGKQLRALADRVDYASIELTILGPVVSTPYQKTTFGERIKELFGNFNGFLSAIALIIISIVIYGIPILLLLFFFFWILFGRIGLMKKLWRIIAAKKQE